MPRAPAQKHNHSSSNAGHPYTLPADSNSSDPAPTSSATSILSSQSQKYFQADQHSQVHMDSLPPTSTLYQQGQDQHYRRDDAGPSVKQQSPRDTSHLQAQSSSVKSESNQGKQQHEVGQEGVTKSTNNSVSPATESSRAQPNAPSDPNSASSSASVKTSGQASGGTATKKKHVCPTCDRAFTTSGHLARHARVHTGERNHKCPFPGCETRCSRQDNLQQHYRIHLSPGSRRSSSSATRAAIRGAIANPTATPSAINTATAADLDAPPPLAQATFPPAHIAHSVQYASGSASQSYPIPTQTSTLPQSHLSSPHITQQPYHSHTPPIPNGAGHVYENGTGNGLTGTDVARGYAHGPPESPSTRSGPGSATPSADASPVIGGPGTSSQTYAGQQQTYIYVQHPGYYQSPQHPSSSPQVPGSSAVAYSTPPPPASGSLDGQYQPQTQPQLSTFYQPHHYPREAYIHSAASASPAAQTTQTPPNYAVQQPLPQQTHDHQGYAEPPNPKAKSKRRGHAARAMSGGSMVNGAEQSPTDSPAVVANALQGHAAANGNHRANGQGQSNVYAFYGMAAPPHPPSSAASHPPPPPSSGSIGGVPPPPSSSHGGTRYTVTSNGSGFGQFQVHTSSPIPPPLTTSSTLTSSYASPHYGQNMDTSNANGTHSPGPVLAPIQTKRPSYHEALPRYSYAQHANSANYASVGKGYSE